MLSSLVVLRSSTWLGDTPSLPHGRDEAEDRHSNFYDSRVNLVRLLAKRQAPTGGHPVVRTDALIRSGVDWGSFGTVLYVNDSCWDHQTDAMDDFVDRRPRDGPQVFWLDISQQPAKVRVAGSNPVVRSTVVRSRRPLQIIEETSLTTSVAV